MKDKLSAIAVDGQAVEIEKRKSDALETAIVVGNKKRLFGRVIGPEMINAALELQHGRSDISTLLQRIENSARGVVSEFGRKVGMCAKIADLDDIHKRVF